MTRFDRPEKISISTVPLLKSKHKILDMQHKAGRLFLKFARSVSCFNKNLKLNWHFNFKTEITAYGISEKYVLLCGQDKRLVVLSMDTGKILHPLSLKQWVGLRPFVYRGKFLLCGNGGFLYSLNPITGKVQQLFLFGKSYSSLPALYDDRFYTGFFDGSLICYDLTKRHIRWQVKLSKAPDVPFQKYGSVGESGIVSTRNFRIYFIRHAGKKTTVSFISESSWVDRMKIEGKRFYYRTHNFSLVCRGLSSSKVFWKHQGSGLFFLPLFVKHYAVCGNNTGKVFVLYKKNGAFMGSVTLKASLKTPPLFFSGRILAAAGKTLYHIRINVIREMLRGSRSYWK